MVTRCQVVDRILAPMEALLAAREQYSGPRSLRAQHVVDGVTDLLGPAPFESDLLIAPVDQLEFCLQCRVVAQLLFSHPMYEQQRTGTKTGDAKKNKSIRGKPPIERGALSAELNPQSCSAHHPHEIAIDSAPPVSRWSESSALPPRSG